MEQRGEVVPRKKKQSLANVYTRFPEINDDEEDEEDESEELEPLGVHRSMQYLAAFAANMGALALGTVLSWPAVALPYIRNDTSIGNITVGEESWVGSIVSLGAVGSGVLGGLSIEAIGRKNSMLVLSLPMFLGWILIHFASSVPMILTGRFITGLFSAVFAVSAPIFTAEMTDVQIRGAVGATFDMMISVGILFIYCLGAFLSWRMQALICSVIPVIIFFLMIFVPESPTYLVKKGRFADATQSLMKYRGTKSERLVLPELEELKMDAAFNAEGVGGFQGFMNLMVPAMLIPVSIGFMIYMFQVLSGLDPILVYTVDIFHSAGAGLDDYTSTIIIGTMQTLAGVVAALVIDKGGRRFLLLISEALMIVALTFLGLYFYLKRSNGDVTPAGLGWLPVTTLAIYVLSYSVGMGPVGYTIMGEILPLQVKGLAGCILTSAKWFMSFLVTKFFQDLIRLLGESGCFWLFASFCLAGFFYILFFVPETKGKSLEDIQKEFRERYKVKSVITVITPNSQFIDESCPLLKGTLVQTTSGEIENSGRPGYSTI